MALREQACPRTDDLSPAILFMLIYPTQKSIKLYGPLFWSRGIKESGRLITVLAGHFHMRLVMFPVPTVLIVRFLVRHFHNAHTLLVGTRAAHRSLGGKMIVLQPSNVLRSGLSDLQWRDSGDWLTTVRTTDGDNLTLGHHREHRAPSQIGQVEITSPPGQDHVTTRSGSRRGSPV